MSIAIVALLILVPLVILGIILFAVISGRAVNRNPNRPGGEEPDEDEREQS